MGQYYYVVNLDKKEYLYPHKLGDGLKLLEICAGGGTPKALIALLADGNGRGGGDFEEHSLIGSWAGDRIVVAGDYADLGNFLYDRELTPDELVIIDKEYGMNHEKNRLKDFTLYELAGLFFKDISLEMRELLLNEGFELHKRWDVH